MKKSIQFTKMHGLGNDFMVVNAISQHFSPTPQLIRHWADRHFGVGFDQLLMVESARDQQADFYYRIFNADGSEVGQCGNGARCLAKFVVDQGLTNKKELVLQTHTSILKTQIISDTLVNVDMGIPRWEPADIPIKASQRLEWYTLTVGNDEIQCHVLSMGNPHAILLSADVQHAAVQTLGERISKHAIFPQAANVSFMQILARDHIRLRVYERGAGETLACGSGACAAAVAGMMFHDLKSSLTVTLHGGDLHIEWKDRNHGVIMTGPVTAVYEASLKI